MARAVTNVQAYVPNVTKNVLIVSLKAFAEVVVYVLTVLVARVTSAMAVKPALTVPIISAFAVMDALIVRIFVRVVQSNAQTAPVTFVPTAVIARAVLEMTAGATTAMFAEIV